MGEITDFFKGAQNTLRSFFSTLEEWDRKTSASLTGYISKVSVDGTVYIEQSVAEDDIAVPLMGTALQLYICWIICALGLDAVCNDGRTVNERMRVVHGLQMLEDDLMKYIGDTFGGNKPVQSLEAANTAMVDVESQVSRLATGRLIEFDFNTGQSTVTDITKSVDSAQASVTHNLDGNHTTDSNGNKINVGIGGKSVTLGSKDNMSKSVGRNSESTHNVARPGSCKACFYVMLHPFMTNPETFRNFMQLNFAPTVSSRWRAVRAKEISFWKDFIFTRDIIEKETRLIKKDKSGVISEMMLRQRSGVWRWLGGMLDVVPMSHNLCNAILIFDKQSFDASCREAHINFDNQYQRQQFFRKTFTMMVIVVDLMYGRVDMYYAGIPQVGNYTFNMINKIGPGKNDNFDLKTIMSAMASNNAPVPRF